MTMRKCALLATAMLLAGCASPDPSISVIHRVARGAVLAVVPFSDCQIANQADCNGSGAKAGTIFLRVLSERPGMHVVALARPVGPNVKFTDDAAIAYAKAKGYRYVVNGEVQDYYNTGHLALHSDRASVSLRVLNTKDGQTIVTYSYQENSKIHLASPDDMLADMAKQLANSISVESKRQHGGDFLIYKGND
jgi:TolB-like protein